MLRFKTSFIAAILVFLSCLAFFAIGVFSFDEADRERYHKLVHISDLDSEETKTSNHRRFDLRKDLYFTKGSGRLQMSLKSASAELNLERQGGKNAMIEHMRDVTCYMQEEVSHAIPNRPMQIIRQLKADSATYHYQKDLFIAENVQITRYLIPGSELVESLEGGKLLMTGLAKRVEFSLKGSEPNFKAHQLKSSIYSLVFLEPCEQSQDVMAAADEANENKTQTKGLM